MSLDECAGGRDLVRVPPVPAWAQWSSVKGTSDEGRLRARCARPRQHDPDVGAPFTAVLRAHRAAMSLRDHRDDRKAEAAPAARARLFCPAEALEGALEKRRRESWPLVGNVQFDDVVARDCKEVDRALPVDKR